MKITSLTIQNLGPHADVTFQFSPGHNLVVGTNGSGKSTVLRALSLALTGTCHLTDKRGKGFERLIRDGATEAVIGVTIEPHGTVTRTKSAKKHKLVLSWADGDKVSDNETRLLDALQLPAETIWAMFDPIPVLERPIEDQRAALLRVLRPAKITVPKSLLDAGVKQISGIEHIESLLKDAKEGTLRDLRRDAKWLDEHPPEDPGEEPKGVNLEERQKLLEGLNAKHVELTKELQTVSAATGTFEERIRRAEEAGPEPSEEQSQALAKAIAENGENLTAARNTEKSIGEKIQIGMNIRTAAVTALDGYKTRLENIFRRLAEIAAQPKFECPADACPIIKDLAARADTEVQSLESEQTAILAKVDTIAVDLEVLSVRIEEHQASMQAAIEARQRLEQKQFELRGLANDAERLAKVHEEAAVATERLIETKERLTKVTAALDKCQQLSDTHEAAVKVYSEWSDKAAAVRKWREDVAAKAAAIDRQQQIVDDLLALRKSMIGGRLEQFLGIMTEFLKPFGIEGVEYSFDGGFVCTGRGADLLSDGQKAMMFESAFKVAVATVTGVGIVAVDDLAPMTDEFRELISESLARSGHQVIECLVGGGLGKMIGWPHSKPKMFFLSDGAVQVVSPAA